jgi:hypothetical protein
MIKKKEIICGSKEELVEYFYSIVKPTINFFKDKTNFLYTKEGMEQQINDIISKSNGIGIIYYLIVKKWKKNSEIEFELRENYIKIKNNDNKTEQPTEISPTVVNNN